MSAVITVIKTMRNCFTATELQYIADALDQYNRGGESKQQRHTVDNLRQIFTLSTQRKEV